MDECIFCKIAQRKIEAKVVYDDSTVVAFRDVNPQAPVHILVIPKTHIERLSKLDEAHWPVLLDVHKAIKKVVAQEKLDERGYRVVINSGKEGGQTVDHLHFHLLGGRAMTWPPG